MKQFTAFEEKVGKFLKKYQTPSCMVAIAKDKKVIYEKAFGYQDLVEKRRADKDTVYGIASLTKSFTCLAIMQLYERGKIDLNAPLIEYLPEFSIKQGEKLKEMTVHHFMTHSSGLPPLPSLDFAMKRKRNDLRMIDEMEMPTEGYVPIETYEQLMDYIRAANIELLADPGELFSYSNDAYGLLGAIIENVSGMTYEAYVETNILQPCQMERTHFLRNDYQIDDNNLATSYELAEEGGQKAIIYPVQDWWDAPAMRATGFLKSTANDMLKYSSVFLNKGTVNGVNILSADSVAKMTTSYIKMDPENKYGYGFGITENFFGHRLLQHGGSLQSVSAKFGMIQEENLAIIVLANLSGFPAARVMELAFNAYFGRDIDAHHLDGPTFPVPAVDLEKYVGRYRSDEDMDVTFEMENSSPEFYYNGESYPIKFIREDVFLVRMEEGYEAAEFVMDDEESVVALSIHHRILGKVNH